MDIVIASYNQQNYLSDAIESVLSQVRKGWDLLIIVDDGSTDNSLAIARSYEKENIDDQLNPKIKVISQVNKGLASARNTGIMNSDADWILFLDADDMLVEGGLKKIRDTIKDHPEADIVSGSFKSFGTSNQEFILMPNPTLEDFKTGNRIGSSSAVRTSALRAVGGYSPRMVEGYEDMHLWVNLLTRGSKIVTIPEIVWLYRTKPESMWTSSLNYHQKLLAQINKDMPMAYINY